MNDGLNTVKIARYNTENNRFSDDIKIDRDILVILGEVESIKNSSKNTNRKYSKSGKINYTNI